MEKPVILCVDDEKYVLQSLRAQLRNLIGNDYSIETTESGEEALEVVEAILEDGLPFPVIISDHIMPGIKGDELLVRVHSLSPDTLKIMLTGQADLVAISNAVNKAGLYRYIAKPWEENDFLITVKEALNKFQINRELALRNEQLRLYNEQLEQRIRERTIELQKKNDDITASIQYARRIQQAMLPAAERINKVLPEHFIFFRPRDIVSGDFYWFTEHNDKYILVAADCTGHGVPGAFMSMIGSELLNQIINVQGITSPDIILQKLHSGISTALNQQESANRDGMDMALCTIDPANRILEYAGAMNPLYYVQNGEFHEIKADKRPIGGLLKDNTEYRFQKHTIPLTETPTMFYICSDGFQDQFGGEKGRKFMVRNFKNLLHEISDLPTEVQQQRLSETFNQWKGNEPQVDDVLVVGFRG